jgi:hypothetical protein
MTLRCTRKLLGTLHVPAARALTQPTTVLGDWYANVYDTRPHPIVLCMSERSLLTVLVPFGDLNSLASKFRLAVLNLLTRLEVPADVIRVEREAMSEIAFGPTANRRVLGCLNEAAFAVSTEFDSMHERWLGDHEMYLSRFIYSTTQYRPPHELAQELLRAARSGTRASLALIH